MAAQAFGILAYILCCKLVLSRLGGTLREALFCILNIAAFYLLFEYHGNDHYNAAFCAYLALVLVQYGMMRLFSDKEAWKPWLAFFTPLAFLAAVRYIPLCLPGELAAGLHQKLQLPVSGYFIGISYMAFRASYLVLEIRNGAVKRPGLLRYLSFCFFLPTIPVGPINPYGNFNRAFEPERPAIPQGRAAMRVFVGLVKYLFLGSLCDRLTYSGLMLNSHYHPWIDLPIAMVFYYLYLYCNFSGFCDMAIGAAGLIGVPVAENFDSPFAARNIRDFWNRWHITLSHYMRDVVFAPLSKFLARIMGPEHVNDAIALTITVVFLLVGVWHGVGWNFFLFGAAHALGVVVNHYYTIGLKKWLGRDRFKAYNANRWIRAAAVVLTFSYCAATLFFFANTMLEMKEIFASLR